MDNIIKQINAIEELKDNVRLTTPAEINELFNELSLSDEFEEEEEFLWI